MNQTIVTPATFDSVVERLVQATRKSFDCETTGLRPYQGDKLFSLIFCIGSDVFYFNFQQYDDNVTFLPRERIRDLQPVFSSGILYAHNAKFDWHMVAQEGIEIDGGVWCTMTGARVEYNEHMRYSLDECLKRIGREKDDSVEEYIKKHKLWEWTTVPGKKKRVKNKYYNQVPFEIMFEYGCKDAFGTYWLGEHQQNQIRDYDQSRPKNKKPLMGVMLMEMQVSKVCQEVERCGVKINKDYCEKAIAIEDEIMRRKEREFEDLTGMKFEDSRTTLTKAFTNLGYAFPLTEKGNPCFDEKALSKVEGPIADIVLGWRKAYKRSGTYFRSFLHYCDDMGYVHANMNQGATVTGRFSYSDPNFQNLHKEETDEFPVRRAIVPREGNCLIAIDYKQMEFRLMLDYAKESGLIERIKKGHDPHGATAEMVGIQRKPAKTLNFGLLYGMGVGKLADTLGVDQETARDFKRRYFNGLPRIKRFLRDSTRMAESRGFVYDWFGRRFHYPDANFAYKAANSIIQGGCAEITKLAMIEVAKILEGTNSHMVLQIHDELLLDMHPSEFDLIRPIVDAMEGVYPYKEMPMECSVEHSWESFGDLKDGLPEDASDGT